MIERSFVIVLTIVLLASGPARAQEALITYKTMSPEIALDLARAALADCPFPAG